MSENPCSLFAIFLSMLKSRFPEHRNDLSFCAFTILDGKVYMWYQPGSPWLSKLGQPDMESDEGEIARIWTAAVDSQASAPWRTLFILPNN